MAKKAAKAAKIKAVCVNCGTFISEGQGVVKASKNLCESCAAVPAAPASEVVTAKAAIAAPKGVLKAICYFASLIPIAGFVMGAVFYPQEDAEVRKFGRNCFIMMAIGIFLGVVFFLMMVAAGAAIGGAADKVNFGEGYF